MEKKLIEDLRNKLTPLKNYLAIRRNIDKLEESDGTGITALSNGFELNKLRPIEKSEQLRAEASFAQIEYIIELLEKTT